MDIKTDKKFKAAVMKEAKRFLEWKECGEKAKARREKLKLGTWNVAIITGRDVSIIERYEKGESVPNGKQFEEQYIWLLNELEKRF